MYSDYACNTYIEILTIISFAMLIFRGSYSDHCREYRPQGLSGNTHDGYGYIRNMEGSKYVLRVAVKWALQY